MNFTICQAEQRSPEWFAARLGRVTGSRASDLLATIKSGEAAARRDYRTQLVVERLTGQMAEDTFVNKEMQRGIDCEPLARAAYEAQTGELVRCTGFLSFSDLPIGCSVDGDVNDFEGIVEMKCPKSATHLRYLKSTGVPAEHLPQITHNLYVTGAAWCDFVSWDDRFPASLQLWIVRVHRTDVDLPKYDAALRQFLAEVDAELAALHTVSDLSGTLKAAVA